MEMMRTSNVTCHVSLINNNDKNSRCYSQNFKSTCCSSQMRYSVATAFISIYMTIIVWPRQSMRGYFLNGCKKLPTDAKVTPCSFLGREVVTGIAIFW